MKILVAFWVFLYTCEAILEVSSRHENWQEFKNNHQKRFSSLDEEILRRSIFEKRLDEIEEHNERYKQGLETYEIGINKYTDFTDEELKLLTHGLRIPDEIIEPLITIPENHSLSFKAALPASVDWRNRGVVTPVKNQGSCGSCWAFSTTGTLEAQYALHYRKVVTVSEQQLVDCVSKTFGCSGGWMTDAYRYIARNGGINYERDYPYQAKDSRCRYNRSKPKITVRGYAYLSGPNENVLKDMVATKGPISVAIDAGGNFAHYSGGVYYNPSCHSNAFTHAVVIVGYGTENGHDYWLVKNSWGTNWGLKGYIKMARNRGNNCGIASKASYPVF